MVLELLYILVLLLLLWVAFQKTIRESYIPKDRKISHFEKSKIVTFNIKKFPWSCKSFRRLNIIGQYSIILLQECFNECYDSLEYWFPDHYICRGTMKGFNLLNSGLAILSIYPVIEIEFHKYKNYNKWSLDCFSEKGFLSVLLDLGKGNKLRVINTHLQSSDYEKYDKNAFLQLQELLEYTSTIREKYIIGGDFNIDSKISSEILQHNISDSLSFYIHSPKEPSVFIDFTKGSTSASRKDGHEGMIFDYFICSNVHLHEPTVIYSSYSDHNPVTSKILEL
jgi:endonuclease/exonuclease/phosphatase family metal-dependent hydrolase